MLIKLSNWNKFKVRNQNEIISFSEIPFLKKWYAEKFTIKSSGIDHSQ